MRILWVTARIFDDKEETQSGVWLKALAIRLASSKEIDLANVSCKPGISELLACDFGNIKQWVLPIGKINNYGYPPKSTQIDFEQVINLYNPDIIQIWGSENPFRLLPFDDKFPGIKVFTMQGVLGSISNVLLSGITLKELRYTIGIREIILRKNLLSERRSFRKAAILESEMVKRSNYIITQSEWTESQIRDINPQAKLYRTQIALRQQFVDCSKWARFDHSRPILYSAAIGYSLKGLHILIKALVIIKHHFPTVELRLAGLTGRRDYLAEGYFRLILKMIKMYKLEKNICWLGAINADTIVENLQQSSVFVQPSFVESYSLTLAEAMSVGTPSVVSFAGAMPELAINNIEALFFTPGDYKRCAYLVIKLLSDKELASKLSVNALTRIEAGNMKLDIVKQQIDIYKAIRNNENLRKSQTSLLLATC